MYSLCRASTTSASRQAFSTTKSVPFRSLHLLHLIRFDHCAIKPRRHPHSTRTKMVMKPARGFSHSSRQPFKVLILGGSYAGLSAALNLIDLCEGRPTRMGAESSLPGHNVPVDITIVDERDGYFHLIGSPMALAEEEYADKTWRKFSNVPALQHPHIRTIQGSVATVDCENMTAHIMPHKSNTAMQQRYDYLVAATGLRRVFPTVPQSLDRAKYLAEAQGHIDCLEAAEHGVAVIGGGAVGIEMAAEAKQVYPNTKFTLIHSRDRLLSSEPLPDEMKDRTLELLREGGVEVVTGKRVLETLPGSDRTTLKLSDGTEMTASHVISAISKPVATSNYLPREVLDSEDLVKVRSSLQFSDSVPNADHHFAIGDLASWSGIKRCGGAMHMGTFAAGNLHRHILFSMGLVESPEYKDLNHFPPAIGIALGDTAIGYSEAEGVVKDGPEYMKLMFGEDLGFTICWNYLGLGKKPEAWIDRPMEKVIEATAALETRKEVDGTAA